jgi:hypothetical protein
VKHRELKVVFDTNILFTGSAGNLLRQEIVDLIKGNSQHADLSLTWYLPEVAMHERLYQMQSSALELLPSIQRLEKFVGYNLNVTEDVVKEKVREVADQQFKELGLQLLTLAVAGVNWQQIMLDSVYRQPPFQRGEKEKGFRDALIAESFLQLVALAPADPKVCRITLVTSDGLLANAVRARTIGRKDVRILATSEELKGLINTLVSEVAEEFVNSIQGPASAYFFEAKNGESLFFKEGIQKRIAEEFRSVLEGVPKGADRRENGEWFIYSPRFAKKHRQRVYWATRIQVEANAYKTLGPGLAELIFSTLQTLTALQRKQGSPVSTESSVGASPEVPQLPTEKREELFAKGWSNFDVTWSVLVTTGQKFTKHRIDGIEHVETSWG